MTSPLYIVSHDGDDVVADYLCVSDRLRSWGECNGVDDVVIVEALDAVRDGSTTSSVTIRRHGAESITVHKLSDGT